MKKVRVHSLILMGCLVAASSCTSYQKRIGPAPDLKVEITPKRVERGKYLANNVAVCMDCHSQRDYTRFSGPAKAGTFGGGGEVFDKKMGLPGTFYGKNITPHALGNWTDGEIYRAMTSGVSKNGKALMPMMPYLAYGKMDSEDVKSIIAYLRTLPAVTNDVPESRPMAVVKPVFKKMTRRAEHQAMPSPQDTVAYGKYLVGAAGCYDCHTQRRMGMPIKSKGFAGGVSLKMPAGTLTSANLTPDIETGLGSWTKESFISRFKSYQPGTFVPFEVHDGFNTIMPWTFYSGMSEQDLGAMYAYLRTLKPIKQKVEKFRPASKG
ncbi:c-type cytochrome [Telluribacter sp. SYSU D00476]|uniref:c-type cytochrome n=1 Tax=Telluribacter sp. SYSU D00476 TaxID=2811430 RepID=UPI001FF11AEC|nr:c-type cytochrome [Telluribacter sp. SYSU D00476]